MHYHDSLVGRCGPRVDANLRSMISMLNTLNCDPETDQIHDLRLLGGNINLHSSRCTGSTISMRAPKCAPTPRFMMFARNDVNCEFQYTISTGNVLNCTPRDAGFYRRRMKLRARKDSKSATRNFHGRHEIATYTDVICDSMLRPTPARIHNPEETLATFDIHVFQVQRSKLGRRQYVESPICDVQVHRAPPLQQI